MQQLRNWNFREELLEPSLKHFCCNCKKILHLTARIVVLMGSREEYQNFCPPCFSLKKDQIDVKEYRILRSLKQEVRTMNNLSALDLIKCIDLLEHNGIDQMEVINEENQQQAATKRLYLKLNQTIFDQNQCNYKQPISKCKMRKIETPEKEFNPPNRKHLKALGYCHERDEFDFLPEGIFGLLIGTLEKTDDMSEEDYSQLIEILNRKYNQQQDSLNQVKKFMVESPYLLGRKGFNKEDTMNEHLLKLKKEEEKTKVLIQKIHSLLNECEENSEESQQKTIKKEKKDKKDKKQKKKKQRSKQKRQIAQKLKEDDRSRTRDKKRRRENVEDPDDQHKQVRNNKLKREKHKEKKQSQQDHIEKYKVESPMEEDNSKKKKNQKYMPIQVKKEDKIQKHHEEAKAPHADDKLQMKSDPSEVGQESHAKRGRGRPRGSVKKAKILGGKFIPPPSSAEQLNLDSKKPHKKAGEQVPYDSEQSPVQKPKTQKNQKQQHQTKQQGFAVQFDSD